MCDRDAVANFSFNALQPTRSHAQIIVVIYSPTLWLYLGVAVLFTHLGTLKLEGLHPQRLQGADSTPNVMILPLLPNPRVLAQQTTSF